jgi:hypothetical protein
MKTICWGRVRAASAARPSMASSCLPEPRFGTWEAITVRVGRSTMTLHRAAPQSERAVRAAGPDDPQRAASNRAEAGNHPNGWRSATDRSARVLSCRRGPGLFLKPRQPLFTQKPLFAQKPVVPKSVVPEPVAPEPFASGLVVSWPGVWSRKRAVQVPTSGAPAAGVPEFSS